MEIYNRQSPPAPPRRLRRPRKFLWLFIVLVILAYGGYCLLRPVPPITSTITYVATEDKATAPNLAWPAGAEAAVGTASAGVLATSNENQTPTPTASVAKLITALTVLDKYPVAAGQPGPTITLGPADVDLYNKYYAEDGSLVQVAAGEKISEFQALEAMLIPSGNNMADSLAIWAYGSLANYRAAAQKFVASLGLDHTIVGSDASGFLPGTKSTPSDLVKLGQAVLANPALAQIVGEGTATVPVAGIITNTNYLLGSSNIIGIKTGNSDEAGGNLLFAASYKTRNKNTTVIGAIMHAPQLVDAMLAATPLLESTEKSIQYKSITSAGRTVASYNVPWLAKPVSIVAQENLSWLEWPDTSKKPSLNIKGISSSKLKASSFNKIAAGSVVGKLSVSGLAGRQSTPLVVNQPINPPSLTWRLTHPL